MVRCFGSVLLAALVWAMAGCYYARVIDPVTGKVYITNNLQQSGYSGAVLFTDINTGRVVTLQQSEIEYIKADEYRK